jgi:hypothetical protein
MLGGDLSLKSLGCASLLKIRRGGEGPVLYFSALLLAYQDSLSPPP